MFSAEGLSLSFGAQVVLDGAGFTLEHGTRAGLVGANGSGKTSLMQILSGAREPDAGIVTVAKGSSLAYLPQRADAPPELSVRDFADTGFAVEHEAARERDRLAERLAENPDDSVALTRLAEIDECLERADYYAREALVGRVLAGLGFKPKDLARPLKEFSGGLQMRASLARTLLTRAEFLLLDEPTNYLDSEARLWLASFIKAHPGGVLLVSHDRAFLDDTVEVIFELFQGKLRRYSGNYSRYEARRQEELEQLVRRRNTQQAEIQRQEQFIRRFRANAGKARQVQSRVRALEKTERVEIPDHLKPISVTLPSPPNCGKVVLQLDGVTKRYGDTPVLRNIELTLTRSRRLAVVGRNGAGKSTLLRMIAGVERSSEGYVTLGTGVIPAYYAQDGADALNDERTVYEYVAQRASHDAHSSIRSVLGAFLFDEDAIQKPLSVLSGGERSRLVMAGLLVRPANLLILDEPTNHLDMTSQKVLAHALAKYEGSVVIVSHDRHFLRTVTTDVLALWPHHTQVPARPPDGWRLYSGTYGEFEGSRLGEVFFSEQPQTVSPPGATTGSKISYAREKERRSEARKLQRHEETLLQRMEELESEHREIQERMAAYETYTDADAMRALRSRLEKNETDQAQTAEEWERVSERLQHYDYSL